MGAIDREAAAGFEGRVDVADVVSVVPVALLEAQAVQGLEPRVLEPVGRRGRGTGA